MKHLLLITTCILLASCGSKTYIERPPVVVEKPVHTAPPVIVEHEKRIER